ncbi:ROK family protein [bacterium]|nr:ROK family protein [bacterium]
MATKQTLGIGLDVGGTKLLAALVEPTGSIIARNRLDTPRTGKPADTVQAIIDVMQGLLDASLPKGAALGSIGLTIPGVVDAEKGLVVVTPNMNLTGVRIAPQIEAAFGVPVAMGNDVNMGTLGEKWLGAAQRARSAVGIFVGTGIGGGVIVDDTLLTGAREAAGEIGHLVMQIGGPRCGCGNDGCLEALASRTAIERDIRQALEDGRKSAVTELLAESGDLMKSGVLRRALKAKDKLVTEVMTRASEIIGYACQTVRHLLDPDVIVLGGGVVEACGRFVIPIVERVLESDKLGGARPGGYVVESELGDDAVVLGAVALAQQLAGGTPLQDARESVPVYPTVAISKDGVITINDGTVVNDVCIRGDGQVKKRNRKLAKAAYDDACCIGPEELRKVCRGQPDVLIVAAGPCNGLGVHPDGAALLKRRSIELQVLSNKDAVAAWQTTAGRKAIILSPRC